MRATPLGGTLWWVTFTAAFRCLTPRWPGAGSTLQATASLAKGIWSTTVRSHPPCWMSCSVTVFGRCWAIISRAFWTVYDAPTSIPHGSSRCVRTPSRRWRNGCNTTITLANQYTTTASGFRAVFRAPGQGPRHRALLFVAALRHRGGNRTCLIGIVHAELLATHWSDGMAACARAAPAAHAKLCCGTENAGRAQASKRISEACAQWSSGIHHGAKSAGVATMINIDTRVVYRWYGNLTVLDLADVPAMLAEGEN
jgi:hypothetical protein